MHAAQSSTRRSLPRSIRGSTIRIAGTLGLVAFSLAGVATAAGIADTKHNLSTTGTGQNHVTAGTADICVFCHTPHGADVSNPVDNPPLWNKRLAPASTYQTYDTLNTSTLDGQVLPVGSTSVACLSCHDGTQAMDNIINAPGSGDYDPTGGGPTGRAYTWTTGGTANADGTLSSGVALIGTDLTNDHPIGVAYCGGGITSVGGDCRDPDFQQLTGANNRLRTATINTRLVWWVETGTVNNLRDRTDMILYSRTFSGGVGPSVECGSCHDPHVSEGQAGPNGQTSGPTFLRVANAGSAVCLACHVK